jgi:CRISPR-associated protein Csm1
LTLFEQLGKDEIVEGELQWRYPLKLLSPESIFPKKHLEVTPKSNMEGQSEYLVLWNGLLDGLKEIPISHKNNLPLWIDHFDALWLTVTHAIPSATAFGVKPEVSLYDHSKATSAMATALWRWHHAHQLETVSSVKDGWSEDKFLLIQGDFFGIQNFIFTEGGETNKHANKLLRGRSFQVALLTECAALAILDALELPPTSQIINAAGKFLILAHNTDSAKNAVERVRGDLNAWCLENTYGEIGIGLATTEASCNDFSLGQFNELLQKLFEKLEVEKYRRFDLCSQSKELPFKEFLNDFNNDYGVCRINGRYPADPEASNGRGYPLSKLADDQIHIGEALTKKSRVLISREAKTLPNLSLDYFGWQIAFVPEGDISGKYGELVKDRKILRCWDFDLPDKDGKIFHGYARRFVNTYVPRWSDTDRDFKKYGKYDRLSAEEIGKFSSDEIKTLHALAVEDGNENSGKWISEIGLTTLKGDVDNLGDLFQQGLKKATFAKWASLSRQMNLFFALWLPWNCQHGKDTKSVERFKNTYTVFAGGDDFFLIGPWKSTIHLASHIHKNFTDYVINSQVTFSAGMVMTNPKVPVRHLANAAETLLESSKGYGSSNNSLPKKDAVTIWGQTVSWADWNELMNLCCERLQSIINQAYDQGMPLSSGLIYSLLDLADKAEGEKCNRYPEDSLWRSQLAYRTARLIKNPALASQFNVEVVESLRKFQGGYRLPLTMLLYSKRE